MKFALFLTLIAVAVGDIVILNGEEPNSQANCARVCAGTTVRQKTNWIDYSTYTTGVYKDVDISKCGFTKIPTITTAIEGASSHWALTGTSAVYSATPTTFRIYIGHNLPNLRKEMAYKCKWNVEWIAVGFTC